MRGTVFTEADRVVRKDKDRTQLHERRHSQSVSGVVRERQERCAERDKAAVKSNAVLNTGHAELAHTVADVAAEHVVVREALHPRPVGEVRAREVGGAAEEFRQRRRQGVECLLACLTGGNAFRGGLSIAKRFKNNVIKPGRKVARQTSLKFRGQFRICLGVIGKHLVPGVFHRLTRRTRVHCGVNRLRHFKGTVLPAEFGLGGRNFFVTQGFTVGLCGTGAVRGPEADHGLGDNQRRTVFFSLGFGNRLIHGIDVVAVHRADHVPAVGFKALTGVVGEPPLHIAVNGNTVVVVNGDEFVKPAREQTSWLMPSIMQPSPKNT